MVSCQFATRLRPHAAGLKGLVAALALAGLPAGCGTQEDVGTTGAPVTTTAPTTTAPTTTAPTTTGGSTNLTPSTTTPPARPTDTPTGTDAGDRGATGTETKTGADQPKVIDKPAEPTPSDKGVEPKAEEKKD